MNTKLLVLDLDETLIFANEEPNDHQPDFDIGEYVVYKRPYLGEFLDFCQEHFDVSVWTSANQLYAEAITDEIFGKEYPLKFIWSRNKCIQRFDSNQHLMEFIKDLRKVKKQGYKLEQVIAIDDTPEKHVKNYGNLVQVSPFLGEPEDNELFDLMKYLLELKHVDNVRSVEKRDWRSRYSNEL